MRVSSMSQYDNFISNQQKILKDLLNVNNQLTTGKKIQFGYEDTSTYIDFLRFDTNEEALSQIIDTSDKAEKTSRHTDVAMQGIKKTLEAFKIKLVNAANATHSNTSLQAIASDLEAFRRTILDSLNSSVGGNFMFSGTNFKQKPFDINGKYMGNADHINAHLGHGVEIAYNVTGQEVAHGYVYDYAKKITTNVIKYSQTDLHPKQLNKENPDKLPKEVPITQKNSIKDLIGNPNEDEPTFFYFRGRRPDGTTFKTRYEMTSDAKVSDLLEKIGREFGNTEIYKAVDVSLSKMGQIEITDVRKGQLLSDFHLVASNIKTANVDTIEETKGSYVFDFNKSGFSFARDSSLVYAQRDYYDYRMFKFSTTLRRQDNEAFIDKFDTAQSLLSKDADTFVVNIEGKEFSHKIDNLTTVEDLLNNIKKDVQAHTNREVDVSLNKGVLGIFDRYNKDEKSPIKSISIEARSSLGKQVAAFSANDAIGYDKARFVKNGSVLTSNVAQVLREKNIFATNASQIKDVSGTDKLEEETIRLDLRTTKGEKKIVEITLRDNLDSNGNLSTFSITDPSTGKTKTYNIYDEYGDKTSINGYIKSQTRDRPDETLHIKEKKDGLTYEQVFSVMSMVLSGNEPTSDDFKSYQEAMKKSKQSVDVGFDNLGQIRVKDLTTSKTKIELSMFSKDSSNFESYTKHVDKFANQTYTGVKGEQGWDLKTSDEDASLRNAFGLDFGSMTLSGTNFAGQNVSVNLNQNMSLKDLKTAINTTFGNVRGDVFAKIQEGKLFFKDNTENTQTLAKINIKFSDTKLEKDIKKGDPFSFMANNTLTVVSANVNLFSSLDTAANAVRAGLKRADADAKDARNIGVQNSIEAIDQLLDHLNRVHTQNGSTTKSLELSHKKSVMTQLNVKELKSMAISADLGEGSVTLAQRLVSYQSLLSLIGKVSRLNLVDYL